MSSSSGSSLASTRPSSSVPAAPSVVKKSSVQSQFASLTRERDLLRRERDTADRERKRLDSVVEKLRLAQSQLSGDLQKAHATLGTEHQKRQLLLREQKRLETMLGGERQELVRAQERLDALQEKEMAEKKEFLKQMHGAQDELEELLDRLEEARWKRLISPDTAGMAPLGNDDERLGEARRLLQEAVDKRQHQEEMRRGRLEELEEWRRLANEEQVNWKQLEHVWSREDVHDDDNDKSMQMNLFYGGAGDTTTTTEEESASAMEEDEVVEEAEESSAQAVGVM